MAAWRREGPALRVIVSASHRMQSVHTGARDPVEVVGVVMNKQEVEFSH